MHSLRKTAVHSCLETIIWAFDFIFSFVLIFYRYSITIILRKCANASSAAFFFLFKEN